MPDRSERPRLHPLIVGATLATFTAALLIYRQIVIAAVDALGIPSAIGIILVCYLVACRIHRRERGY